MQPKPIVLEWKSPSASELEIVEGADHVEAFRYVMKQRRTESIQTRADGTQVVMHMAILGDLERIRVPLSDLSEAQRKTITRVLLSDAPTRPPSTTRFPCSLLPDYEMRFWRGTDSVDARFTMGCTDVRLGSGGGPIDSFQVPVREVLDELASSAGK